MADDDRKTAIRKGRVEPVGETPTGELSSEEPGDNIETPTGELSSEDQDLVTITKLQQASNHQKTKAWW